VQNNVEQAALTARGDLRHPGHGVGDRTARSHDPQITVTFGYEHASVGQKGQPPGVLKTVCNNHSLDTPGVNL
jgi:hypothetical protein